MKILIENGAEKYSKNAYGLNCLHIAAQSDQAISLYYFRTLGMNIYSRSNDGLTPLHWACYANSEIAMIYLLAWYDTECLNMKDKEGSTPLHLTIKSADDLGSGRPMRALLMAGADKDAVDKKKKNARWFAAKLQNKKLSRELVNQLSQKSRCSCLQLKSTLTKSTKDMKMSAAFLIFFDLVFFLNFALIFPLQQSEA